jgi:hypothetical protein
METYQPFMALVQQIKDPNRIPALELYLQNEERFLTVPGSSHNHQAWRGGYYSHITEVMNIANLLYRPLNEARPLPFELSDALLTSYLHDVEKLFVYDGNGSKVMAFKDKEERWEFKKGIISKYGFDLTPEQWNAVQFAEGELHWYSPKERMMGPLAAFVHMCDNWSARGWHDYPRKDDPWR